MRLQLIKLFVVIILTLLFVAWSTERLFQEYQSEQSSNIDLEQFFQMIDISANNELELKEIQLVAFADLAWPEEMVNILKASKIVSLTDSEGKIFHYRMLNDKPDRVFKIGPFYGEKESFVDLSSFLPIIFYLVFAFVLWLWLWPMFRDLSELIHATDKFSKTRSPIKLEINKTSLIAPLSQSVINMSQQILRFISLQRFLASTVSHDIRTPVSRINFLVEMCDNNNVESTKESINQNLDEIDRLTDDFIELARLEEFHNQLNIERNNLNDWLLALVNKINNASDISCELTIDGNINFYHDTNFLSRALQNLVANAIKYAKNKVQISVTQTFSFIFISVEDDGPGINPEEQQKVLGLYQRGKTETNKGSGYGLGLAFVRIICDWHHGELIIERSDKLKGAKLTLKLPAI